MFNLLPAGASPNRDKGDIEAAAFFRCMESRNFRNMIVAVVAFRGPARR
jgi:hypothetical protein